MKGKIKDFETCTLMNLLEVVVTGVGPEKPDVTFLDKSYRHSEIDYYS